MPKVLMVVHSYYPSDPRVRREAEALRARGDAVDVVCLREAPERRYEVVNGIGVHRLPVKRHRGSGFAVYLWEYLAFFLLALLKTTALFFRNRYQVIQVHTLPDFLVFCALVPRFFGSSVVLDMHEVMPEFFRYRYHLSDSHPVSRVVKVMERLSTGFADRVITVSDPLKEILIARGVPTDKITVVMNMPDELVFRRPSRASPQTGEKFTLAYHGLVSDIYDLGIVLKGLALLKGKVDGLRFMVIGNGPQLAEYKRLTSRLDLEGVVSFTGYQPREEVVKLLNEVDIGIVPLADNEFTDLAFPTKIVEYIALDIPVITANRMTIRRYFNEGALSFYEVNKPSSLADCIDELYRHPESRNNLVKESFVCYKEISWEKMKQRYYQLIDELSGPKKEN